MSGAMDKVQMLLPKKENLKLSTAVFAALGLGVTILIGFALGTSGDCVKFKSQWTDKAGCNKCHEKSSDDRRSEKDRLKDKISINEPYCCIIAPGDAGTLQLTSLVIAGIAIFAFLYGMVYFCTKGNYSNEDANPIFLGVAIASFALQVIVSSFGLVLSDACECYKVPKGDDDPPTGWYTIVSGISIAWAVLTLILASCFYTAKN